MTTCSSKGGLFCLLHQNEVSGLPGALDEGRFPTGRRGRGDAGDLFEKRSQFGAFHRIADVVAIEARDDDTGHRTVLCVYESSS